MTAHKSLSQIVGEMRSACSFYEARAQEMFAAPIRLYVPALEALCSGGMTPVVGLPISSDLTTGGVAQMVGWQPETIARHARAGSFSSAYTVPGGGWRIPPASVQVFLHPEPEPSPPAPIRSAPMTPTRKGGFDRAGFVAPFRASTTTERGAA